MSPRTRSGRLARTTLRVLSFQENRSASTNRDARTARSHAEGAPPSVFEGGSWVFLSRALCALSLRHKTASMAINPGSPGSRQFLHKESSRTLGPQQIQPPIATESHKMQISPPVIPFQSIRHRALPAPPQDPPSQTEGGAPSAYLYFSCRFRNGILPCGRPCQEKIKCPGPPVPIWLRM